MSSGGEKINPWDDQYLMLAYYIVSHYSLPEIRRALTDDEWVRTQVQKDCMLLDLCGPWVDAIVQDLDDHKRLWLRGRMKELGAELFTQLDLKRLRRNIFRIIAIS